MVVGRLGVGVEVDWSGGGGTGLCTAGGGPVDGVGVVVWLCAGDCTAALVREPIGGAGVGGAGAGVASDVPEISPSRFRLMPRVVLSLRLSAVALRRI